MRICITYDEFYERLDVPVNAYLFSIMCNLASTQAIFEKDANSCVDV